MKSDKFYTRTVTCSVRADKEFFDKVKVVAKKKGMNRNKYILYLINKYIDKEDNNE